MTDLTERVTYDLQADRFTVLLDHEDADRVATALIASGDRDMVALGESLRSPSLALFS